MRNESLIKAKDVNECPHKEDDTNQSMRPAILWPC
jgi:hypothetical protein